MLEIGISLSTPVSRLPIMQGVDCRLPSGWWNAFKPPDRAKNNKEVLGPLYTALKKGPPEGWKYYLELKFTNRSRKRRDSLLLKWNFDGGGFQVGTVTEVTELLTGLRSPNIKVLRLHDAMMRLEAPTEVSDSSFKCKDFMVILEALKVNKYLKILDMSGIGISRKGAERILGGILDLLQVNTILEEIDLSGTLLARDGSNVKVQAQLQKNGAVTKPLSALKALPMMAPNVARVFLCGFPFAGKTQLRRTMAGAGSGFFGRSKEYLKSIVSHFNLLRTTGIEVEVLQRADLKISLWDLGGQDEFHAFHDLLIPNVNGYRSASSFVIACSPIVREDVHRIKHPNFKDKETIEREVDYWMRFIASNSTISEAFKPHVSLVFTHADYVPKNLDMKDTLKDVLSAMKLKFEDCLQIFPDPFIVNGRLQQSVEPLLAFLEEDVREILKKSSKIYQVCQETQFTLSRWNIDNPYKPLIKWDEFESMCKQHVPSFQDELKHRFQDICRAIALSLHDTGDVIYFEKLKYVVVNPNYFCHDIMGKILSLEEMSSVIFGEEPVTNEKGFVERKVLKSILQGSYVDKSILSKKTKKVDGEVVESLIQVMMEMNLCFEDLRKDDEGCNCGLFIPATLRDRCIHALLVNTRLQWQHLSKLLPNLYIGRRLECEDLHRTFLTQGFFPRLQVFFKKKFNLPGAECLLEQNIISVRLDGKEVLVEYCGESTSPNSYDHMNGYIDILVKSSKSSDESLAFVKEHVVNFIRQVCYSATFGCPGVKLVESILNPTSVEELWGAQSRRNQAVRVEKLIADVMSSSNSTHTPNSDYLHEWPRPGGNDRGQDLLGNLVWQELLNQRYQELEEYQSEILDIEETLLNEVDESPPPTNGDEDHLSALDQQHAFVYESIKASERAVIGRINKLDRKVIHRIDRLESNLTKKMEGVIALQNSLMSSFSKNMDRVIDFATHMQRHRVPHLMYLTTQDASTCEWLLTSLLPNVTTVQMHFMCEHVEGIHRVDRQEGYPLILAGETALRARPYVILGLRVISILAKIGGLALAGMGSFGADLDKVVQGIASAMPMNPVSSSFGEECVSRKLLPESSVPVSDQKAAEQWLVSFIRKKDIDIAQAFDLHRIRYTDGSRKLAWVCGKHKRKGCRMKTMEIVPA
ncbi:hypothetical protein KC19_1G025200 [Ceratodon purpureus]|uniref:C-terminal of Roc (COR) domain-containing protein n=1 Tax=Ceratodon purpureus TaxID=3225 RepID=A0A8T0J310_CERPU|nr:hypothetical protein KC19_1G025200 [Ceratodon purpureus]